MQILPPEPRVGDLVRVRRERWRVADIAAHDDCRLLTLTGAGAANLGIERRYFSPFDLIERVDEPTRPRLAGSHRWRGALRALIADSGSTEILRTACRADIALLPHQLEPALAVTQGMGTRLLIADEVGLGKTIQAGLIVAELAARGAAERTLIVTPAGLRDQWVEEMWRRFGLEGTLLDAREVRLRASRLAVGVNPWTTSAIVVTSTDYLKQPEVLAAASGCRWDALIVDEAHGAAPGTGRYRAISALAARAAYVVLLTATPHNGDRDAFITLCELGARPRPPGTGREQSRLLVFRRTRQEVALGLGRRVHRLIVEPTAAERRMHALLDEFTHAVRHDRGEANRDVWLALTMLHKRALSSARALELSVRRRLLGLTQGPADPGDGGPAQLFLPLDDEDGEIDQADLVPAWTEPALNDRDRERALLCALADAAACAAQAESKVARLTRLLAVLTRRSEHALVFTEYRDTLLHLQHRLPVPTAVLHGGLTRSERRSALDAFDRGQTPLLLATDTAGEGLNLHRACRVVINLELPWSPVRLEQRMGRVDRIGQQRRVHAFHLIAHGTGEAAMADRLRARIAAARAELGGADPLGDTDRQVELQMERLIVFGTSPDAGTNTSPVGEPVPVPGHSDPTSRDEQQAFRLLRLRVEAGAEHARLVRARRLIGRRARRQHPLGEGPLVARATGPAVRAMLGSGWLVVVRSAIEDAFGRPVAMWLTPMRLRVTGAQRSAALAITAATIARIETHVAGAVRLDREGWLASSVQCHTTFWAARLAREHASCRTVAESGPRQLGLFARGTDRLTSSRAANADDEQRRLDELLRRTSELHVAAGRIVLVVVP